MGNQSKKGTKYLRVLQDVVLGGWPRHCRNGSSGVKMSQREVQKDSLKVVLVLSLTGCRFCSCSSIVFSRSRERKKRVTERVVFRVGGWARTSYRGGRREKRCWCLWGVRISFTSIERRMWTTSWHIRTARRNGLNNNANAGFKTGVHPVVFFPGQWSVSMK